MNEKQKAYLNKQNTAIFKTLSDHFKLPLFQDDVADDEVPKNYNYFLLIYGDIESTSTTKTLVQDIYVIFVTENNELVDEQTLDIISVISNVPGINFNRSLKQRLQKKDKDEFLDQVTVIFRRKMTYECKIRD